MSFHEEDARRDPAPADFVPMQTDGWKVIFFRVDRVYFGARKPPGPTIYYCVKGDLVYFFDDLAELKADMADGKGPKDGNFWHHNTPEEIAEYDKTINEWDGKSDLEITGDYDSDCCDSPRVVFRPTRFVSEVVWVTDPGLWRRVRDVE